MKVVRSLRASYESQLELNTLLMNRFKVQIESQLEHRWHYEGRVKKEESFAQKIETGRFVPSALEDFFACTIVVENADAIKRATKIIKSKCNVIYRRPKSDKRTHKSAEQFPFDDLRLYVKLKPDPTLPPEPITDLIFEVQIKTYLQHAWSIATHDLIYKADEISWAQQRIAYQTKALLESAETAISSSKALADDPIIDKEDSATGELKRAIAFLRANWNDTTLPTDIVRLADTLNSLCKATNINIPEIQSCINDETAAGRGKKIINLPPYLIIIQCLITSGNAKMKSYLTSGDGSARFKVLITAEITIPRDYPTIVSERSVTC